MERSIHPETGDWIDDIINQSQSAAVGGLGQLFEVRRSPDVKRPHLKIPMGLVQAALGLIVTVVALREVASTASIGITEKDPKHTPTPTLTPAPPGYPPEIVVFEAVWTDNYHIEGKVTVNDNDCNIRSLPEEQREEVALSIVMAGTVEIAIVLRKLIAPVLCYLPPPQPELQLQLEPQRQPEHQRLLAHQPLRQRRLIHPRRLFIPPSISKVTIKKTLVI